MKLKKTCMKFQKKINVGDAKSCWGKLVFSKEPQLNKSAKNVKSATLAKCEAAKAEKEKLMLVKEENPKRKLDIGDMEKSNEKSPKRIKRMENNVSNLPAPPANNVRDFLVPPPLPHTILTNRLNGTVGSPRQTLWQSKKKSNGGHECINTRDGFPGCNEGN
ncbi:hypothetical protein R1flu_025177 [Riccia fluitans]|uniref:Uncharacterized protein n=1 Tax=Riccia fluitans TaxID=41844 RepID=A0ABD1XX03_9MARC